MIIFAILLVAAIMLVAFSLGYEESVSIYEKLKGEKKRAPFGAAIVKPFLPLGKILIRRLQLESGIKKRLAIAKWTVPPEEFFSWRLALAVFIPLLMYVGGIKGLLPLLMCAAGGIVFPGFVLEAAVRKRQEAVLRALPETIDFLSLYIGAGLDFTGAMRWLVKNAKVNPLIEEFSTVLEDIRVGKSRAQALKDMARKLEITELTSFVLTLVQSERMGTPVEETFDILSDDFRMFRYQKGQREANKAPIKLLIPLIFCILPIIGIIVATPIFLRFQYSGWFAQ